MGTSVGAVFGPDNTVKIGLRIARRVRRSGRPAQRRVSSPKFTEPLRDIPQTINVIPQAMIQEQGATTLRDVLRNVVGITFQAGEGGVPAGDQLTIRGFSARTDMFIDGVRDFGGYSRDSFNLEQVEVVEGPLVGDRRPRFDRRRDQSGQQGAAGRQGRTTSRSAAATPTTSARRRTSISRSSAGVALRVNAMWTDTGVPGRDVVESERWGVAPSLAFGLDVAEPSDRQPSAPRTGQRARVRAALGAGEHQP